MSTTIVIACPSCGIQKKPGTECLGQKVQCGCGMSYSVSPVFAVIPREGWLKRWLGGPKEDEKDPSSPPAPAAAPTGARTSRAVTVAATVVLFAGSAALAV